MKTKLLVLIISLFPLQIISQITEIKVNGFYWREEMDRFAKITLSLSAPYAKDNSWTDYLKSSYLEHKLEENNIYPTQIIKSDWDDFAKKYTAKATYIIDRRAKNITLHLPEQLGGNEILLMLEWRYRDTVPTVSESFFNKLRAIGTFQIKGTYSITGASGSSIPSWGFGVGLYPKIYSSSDKKTSLYLGGGLDFLYSGKADAKKLNEIYSVNKDEFRIIPVSGNTSHNVRMITGSIIFYRDMGTINPVLMAGAGLYTISFNELKIYNSITGKSAANPVLTNLGFKVEAGINLFKLIYAGYVINIINGSSDEINFMNKTQLYHTFMLGIMGL